jgi:hypothetical protein
MPSSPRSTQRKTDESSGCLLVEGLQSIVQKRMQYDAANWNQPVWSSPEKTFIVSKTLESS